LITLMKVTLAHIQFRPMLLLKGEVILRVIAMYWL